MPTSWQEEFMSEAATDNIKTTFSATSSSQDATTTKDPSSSMQPKVGVIQHRLLRPGEMMVQEFHGKLSITTIQPAIQLAEGVKPNQIQKKHVHKAF